MTSAAQLIPILLLSPPAHGAALAQLRVLETYANVVQVRSAITG